MGVPKRDRGRITKYIDSVGGAGVVSRAPEN